MVQWIPTEGAFMVIVSFLHQMQADDLQLKEKAIKNWLTYFLVRKERFYLKPLCVSQSIYPQIPAHKVASVCREKTKEEK